MLEAKTTRFDAIILLCGGSHKNRYQKPHVHPESKPQFGLNFESSFKAKAAGYIYNLELTPVIISSGGPMWGAPPLGHLMANYLSSHRLSDKFFVPARAIIEENLSTDSGEQVKHLAKIIEGQGFHNIGVVADSVHLQLVIPLFRNWGIKVEGLPIEDYLGQANPRYFRIIDKLHQSIYWKWWRFKYSRLQKNLAKNPTLSSPLLTQIIKFQRTNLPWLRLPGTT